MDSRVKHFLEEIKGKRVTVIGRRKPFGPDLPSERLGRKGHRLRQAHPGTGRAGALQQL